jgi:hypothetical protein
MAGRVSAVFEWMGTPWHGLPRIVFVAAPPFLSVIVLFMVGIVIDNLEANSVRNNTQYVAECTDQGAGPLDGPVRINPHETKESVSPYYDCEVMDEAGAYIGCLVMHGQSIEVLVSDTDFSVRQSECGTFLNIHGDD